MASASVGEKPAKPTPEDAIRHSAMQKTGAYSYYEGHEKGKVGGKSRLPSHARRTYWMS